MWRHQGSRWLAAGVAAILLTASGALSGEVPPPLPGPAPRARHGTDVGATNAACAGCHLDEAREWQASMHKRAWTDPVFAAAYALEPIAFCRACHAPEADPARPPDASARDIGVGCVTCHLEGERVVGARTPPRRGPHAVFADARLATEGACAGCHQFAFPTLPAVAMQNTAREHGGSPRRDVACAGCHMPRVAGPKGPRRRHDFTVFGRPEMIRSAVAVEATRAGDGSIRVAIRATGAGHAVPTGDMFRRLEVVASAEVDGATIASAPVVFGRSFALVPPRDPAHETPLRVPVADDRVPASGAPREALLIFPASIARATVRWEVAYARMGPALGARLGVDLARERIVVARGELPPASGGAKRAKGSP